MRSRRRLAFSGGSFRPNGVSSTKPNVGELWTKQTKQKPNNKTTAVLIIGTKDDSDMVEVIDMDGDKSMCRVFDANTMHWGTLVSKITGGDQHGFLCLSDRPKERERYSVDGKVYTVQSVANVGANVGANDVGVVTLSTEFKFVFWKGYDGQYRISKNNVTPLPKEGEIWVYYDSHNEKKDCYIYKKMDTSDGWLIIELTALHQAVLWWQKEGSMRYLNKKLDDTKYLSEVDGIPRKGERWVEANGKTQYKITEIIHLHDDKSAGIVSAKDDQGTTLKWLYWNNGKHMSSKLTKKTKKKSFLQRIAGWSPSFS